MKQFILGIIILLSLFFYWDYLPGFLSLFGLTYFIWGLVGFALICAGIKEINKKSDKTELMDEAQRLLNQHYWK